MEADLGMCLIMLSPPTPLVSGRPGLATRCLRPRALQTSRMSSDPDEADNVRQPDHLLKRCRRVPFILVDHRLALNLAGGYILEGQRIRMPLDWRHLWAQRNYAAKVF